MSWASALTALGLFLTGHALLAALRPTRERSALERHATALLLGAAVLPAVHAALVILAGSALSVTTARVLILAPSLAGVAALLRGRGASLLPAGPSGECPRRRGHVVAGGLLVAFAAFAVFAAGSMPMHVFDPVYHFAYKGKLVFHEGIGTAAWTDLDGRLGRIITHPEYPPGIPSLQALVGAVNGAFDEDAARALMALFVVVPAAWIFCALRGRSRSAALVGALLWTTLPLIHYSRAAFTVLDHPSLPPPPSGFAGVLHQVYYLLIGSVIGPERASELFRERGVFGFEMPDGWTLDGAGDLPLAALLLGAFLHLWRGLPGSGLERDRADPWIGGLLLTGVLLVKNEGLALAGIVLLALALWMLLPRGAEGPPLGERVRAWVRGVALPAGLAAAITAPWFRIRRTIPTIDENYPELMKDPATIHAHLDRWDTVLVDGFLTSFVNLNRWSGVWIVFLAAVLWWLVRRPHRLLRHPVLPALLTVAGALLLYGLILVVTPWNLETLFATVIPGRLMLHVTPIAILAACALLWRRAEEL
jgi:hypothetical protein